MFPVYTGVVFGPVTLDRQGISISLVFDTPPNPTARAPRPADRSAYWEHASKKRLMQGALIALIWNTEPNSTRVYLGTISSSTKDLVDSARQSRNRITIRVSFFDPQVELRILDELKNTDGRQSRDLRILTESSVMFESIRPFLEALRVEPTTLPFERYLAHPDSCSLSDVVANPPTYCTMPNFEYEIGSLFHDDSGIRSLKFSPLNTQSVEMARSAMKAVHPSTQSKRASRLDPSQSDAVIDALTREVTLIQGCVVGSFVFAHCTHSHWCPCQSPGHWQGKTLGPILQIMCSKTCI
jgi:hypothetical protein